MKKLSHTLMLLALVAGGALAAAAQDPPPPGTMGGGQGRFQMPSFADLDKNKDKKLSRDEVPERMAQFFDRLDDNKDGVVDEEEWNRRQRMGGGGNARLSELLTKFMDANRDAKVTREEFARVTQVFDALDKDKSGDLTQEEMAGFFMAINEVSTQATGGVEVNNLFDKFDKNKDSKIAADEMNNEKTFKALDLDKDGAVTRAEAEQALKALADRSRQKDQPRPQQ
jgi:Ca2+-binding EF-hand superfamily protein